MDLGLHKKLLGPWIWLIVNNLALVSNVCHDPANVCWSCLEYVKTYVIVESCFIDMHWNNQYWKIECICYKRHALSIQNVSNLERAFGDVMWIWLEFGSAAILNLWSHDFQLPSWICAESFPNPIWSREVTWPQIQNWHPEVTSQEVPSSSSLCHQIYSLHYSCWMEC